MIREKQTKQVKHCVLSVYTTGPCFVLGFVPWETFFCKDRRSDEHRIYPMITGIVIIRVFWCFSQKKKENPQNFLKTPQHFFEKLSWISKDAHQDFLRILLLRIFWGSASSEYFEDPHPQHLLTILRIFLKIVILRIFWGSSSFEFSEDHHPQNFLRILILRFFWGSSEFSINKRVFKWKCAKKNAYVQT